MVFHLPTRRCSEREPADSLRDEFNVIGGWLPSLTFALASFAHTIYEYQPARKGDALFG